MPSRLDSADPQSIDLPSRIAPAISGTCSSLATFHLFNQPNESALCGLPRGVSRRLAQDVSELLVAVAHFDPCDNRFTFLGPEALQRALLPLHCLPADRLLER